MSRSSIALSIAPQGQEAEQKYKKLLEKMAINPKYQYFVAAFVTIGIALIVFNVMIGSFVFMNPIFICEDGPSTEQQACANLHLCRIQNNFTAVYKNRIYCEKQILRSTIQSALGYGYIIGRISFPILSDVIGRRKTMLLNFLSGILTMSFLLLGIEYNSEELMITGQVLSGIFGSGVSTMGGIYSIDFCANKIRDFCITNAWAIWGLVQMFFYILYEYIPGWRFYLTATLLIPSSIIFLLLLFFLIESPVYAIFVKKSPRMVNQIVDQLSRFNRFPEDLKNELKEEAKEIILLLENDHKTDENYFKITLRRIFCEIRNLKVIISFIFIGLSFIFFYFGMQGSMESSGYNFGVTMLVVGFTEFVGYFISAPIAQKMKRKLGTFISVILTSVIGILFAFQFVDRSQTLQTILIAAARLMSNFFYCVNILFYYESLEVQIRSLSFSIIDGASQLARIVIPYSINIMYGLHIHPIIGFSILFVLMGALPVLPLKQTYNKAKQKSLITEKQTEYEKSQGH